MKPLQKKRCAIISPHLVICQIQFSFRIHFYRNGFDLVENNLSGSEPPPLNGTVVSDTTR